MTQSRTGRPTLVVEGGPQDGVAVAIAPGQTIVVGSDKGAGLRLDHPEVAAAHARISWDDLGVSVTDAESGQGTWLNGEPVEAAPLGDGDVVQLADPKKKRAVPVVRVRLPKGLGEPGVELGDAPAVRAHSAAPAPDARRAGAPWRPRVPVRTGGAALRRLDRRVVVILAVALALAVAGLLAKRLFFTAPHVESLQPAAAEAGRLLTVTGARFSAEAAGNTVWFGDVAVPADSSTGDVLQVKVPAAAAPGPVALAVETRDGRSGKAAFRVLPVLRAAALVPEGGLPGEEVVVEGEGFSPGVTVSVGGAAASVVAADPQAVRFRVPDGAGAAGARVPVIATVEGRSTAPLALVLGRVPLVEATVPPRAMGGEVVRLRGVGFAPEPEANAVTFDGAAAVVVAASRTELVVVAPLPSRAQAETLAPLVVQALGRTSEPRGFPLQRLVDGAWVPRCVVQPAGDGAARSQVLIGTEIGPLLMLSWKDQSPSTALRALGVCVQVDAALGRARVGEPVAFEARDDPGGGVGVGVVGRADTVVRVTAQDAAAYQAPPGLAARSDAPTPAAVARYWAVLLDDLVAVATSAEEPSASGALSPAAGRAFASLRAALPWQYGAGVPSGRVAALPADVRRRLRDAALAVP